MNLLGHRSRLWTVLLIVVLLVSGIAVSAQDTNFCASPGVELIEYGDTVEGTINNRAAAAVFCFEGNEGDVVTITIDRTSGDLRPVIALADPTLSEIFAQDDGRSSAEIVFELPDDGTYLIFATRVDLQDGDTSGDYELTLDAEVAERPDEPIGQPVGVNPDLPQIAATAGGAIAVSYPEDWQVLIFQEGDGMILANSDEALEGDIGRGDFSMRVSFYFGDFIDELAASETFEDINETIGSRPSPLHLAVLEFLVFSASAEDQVEILEFDDGPDINGNPSAVLRLDPGDRTQVFVLSFETDEGDYISLVSRARSNDIEDFEETIFLIAENILTGDAVEEVMGGSGSGSGGGGSTRGGDVFCEVSPVSRDVNIREEPTTNSDLVGTLERGDSAVAVGQAEDNGGFIWWELEDGGFVREDTVNEEGDCEDLPESN